jgi:hypothetical protein
LTAKPAGLASGGQVGAPAATASLTASPLAIGTGEAFGTPTASTVLAVQPSSIPTGELFGLPEAMVALLAAPVGIPSSEWSGTATATGTGAPEPGHLVATNTAASRGAVTNSPSSSLTATHPRPVLAPSNTLSKQLEVSHGV